MGVSVLSKDKNIEISELALETLIDNVIKIPGVKVDRNHFLEECLLNETKDINKVIEVGTIKYGFDNIQLKKLQIN